MRMCWNCIRNELNEEELKGERRHSEHRSTERKQKKIRQNVMTCIAKANTKLRERESQENRGTDEFIRLIICQCQKRENKASIYIQRTAANNSQPEKEKQREIHTFTHPNEYYLYTEDIEETINRVKMQRTTQNVSRYRKSNKFPVVFEPCLFFFSP